MFYVEFLKRDFSERTVYPWSNVEVDRYSFSAVGGPKYATLTLEGNENALWELAEMLRAPVIIWDMERGKKVWWGYIERVKLHIDGMRRKVGIKQMANRVAVAYTHNNQRLTTSFAADTDSVNEFGKKEILLSATQQNATQAESYRDTTLDSRKYPSVSVPFTTAGGENFAEVRCRGWFETLSWQYYDNDSGEVAYTELDDFAGREVQRQSDGRPRLAQSFTNNTSSSFVLDKVYLRARKEDGSTGGVIDNLEVYLYDDSGGEPNTKLSSGSVDHTDVNAYMDWLEFDMSTGITLTTGTLHWLQVQNETYPSVDKDDYFMIDGNASEGYTDGSLLLYDVNSSGWVSWNEPMDMNFRVVGLKETTTQISNIVSDAGEFILGTNIIDASGVNTNPKREGDNTAKYEIKELMERGSSNNLRMLARVLPNYYLEVYEEPEKFEDDYIYGEEIIDKNGAVVPPQECPVGVWMRYEDAIPGHVNTTRLSNATHVFVDEAEYRARDDSYRITQGRDISRFKEIFGVTDG